MPEISQYKRQVNAPNVQITQPAFRGSANIAAGGGAIGNALFQRGQQLAQRYDAVNVLGAFNAFRDQSRAKLDELHLKEGRDAQGVQRDYEDWYSDAANGVADEFIKNDTQRRLFDDAVGRRRQSDLDSLAAHELRQDRVYRDEQIKNSGAASIMDVMASTAAGLQSSTEDIDLKFARVDEGIDSHVAALRLLYPGHDTSLDEKAFIALARKTQMQEIIATDPMNAEKYLKHYKNQLGTEYYGLKKSMEAGVKQDRIDGTVTGLSAQFSKNPYGAVGKVLNPANWSVNGGSLPIEGADEATAVASYYRNIASDKRQIENQADERRTRTQEKYQLDYLTSLADPQLASQLPPISEAANKQLISPTFYKWWLTGKDEAVEDDYDTYTSLIEDSARNRMARADVDAAVESGRLTATTGKKLIADDANSDVKAGRAMILKALQPSPYDKKFQDRQLKLVEALNSYDALLSSEMSPRAASDSVIAQFTGVIRRSKNNIGKSRYLTSEVYRFAENEIDAISAARAAAAGDFNLEQITFKEYQDEMDKLDRREVFLRQQQQIKDAQEDNSELNKLLQKKTK